MKLIIFSLVLVAFCFSLAGCDSGSSNNYRTNYPETSIYELEKLENRIYDLEYENSVLEDEYDELRSCIEDCVSWDNIEYCERCL